MNFTLYKYNLKRGIKPLIALSAIITLYFTVIVYMYDPEMQQLLVEYAKLMPTIFSAFGMEFTEGGLLGFIVNYLYGFFMILIPIILIYICANRFTSQLTDQGSMACLLASPISRVKIILTQSLGLISVMAIFTLYTVFLGLITSKLFYPGDLEIEKFLLLSLSSFCLYLLVGGICFLAGCIFTEVKTATSVGLGFCLVSYVLQMTANTGDKFDVLKYFSFFTLYDPKGLIAGDENAFLYSIFLGVAGLVLFALSIFIFKKKDLAI